MKIEFSEEDKKALKILHAALSIGPVLISLLAYFFLGNFDVSNINWDLGMTNVIGIGSASIALLAAPWVFNKILATIDDENSNEENVLELRRAHVARWAFIEGAALINILLFAIQDNSLNFIIGIFMIVILILSRPQF